MNSPVADFRARGHVQRSRADLLHDLQAALESLGAVATSWAACGARESDLAGIGRTCEGVRRLLADLDGGAPHAA